MSPAKTPRVLTATRSFLTFALALDVFGIVAGLSLGIVAVVAPQALRTGTSAQAQRVGGLGLLITTALAFAILLQLRHIVDSAISGDPFRAENGRRLRRIAWLIFGIDAVTRTIGMGIGMAQFPRHAPFGFPLSFMGVITVLMLLVLAHIFEYGTQLRSEVQGTV